MDIDIGKLEQEIKFLEGKLEEVNSISKKLEIAHDVGSLYKIYGYLMYEENNISVPDYLIALKERINEDLFEKFIRQINDMWNYHQTTSKNILQAYNEAGFQWFDKKQEVCFKKNEVLDILYDFFNWCSSKYYKFVKKMIDNNQVAITPLFDDYRGICDDIRHLKKSYVLCDIENFNIYTMSILVHELGHALEYEFLRNQKFKQILNRNYSNYIEVSAMFFQKLFLEYLLKNKVNNRDTLSALNNLYAEMFFDFLDIRFNTHPNMISQEENDFFVKEKIKMVYKDIVRELKSIKDIHKLLSDINFAFDQAIIGGYGRLVALHFVEQYKYNPKVVLNNLRNFISSIGIKNEYDILNTCGLSADEISNGKVLKKELKTHMDHINVELEK